jgi:hypothetical protein
VSIPRVVTALIYRQYADSVDATTLAPATVLPEERNETSGCHCTASLPGAARMSSSGRHLNTAFAANVPLC